MKIIHLLWSLGFGGIESMIIDLINAQASQHEIHLIIINKKEVSDSIHTLTENVNVHFMNRKPGSSNLLKIAKLNYTILKINADIIHCHIENQHKVLLRNFSPPTLLTVHDVNKPLMPLKKYNRLVAISHVVRKDLASRGNLSAEVIHNGINTEFFRKKQSFENQYFNIVQISRLEHEKKGQDILIKAADIIRQRHPQLNFHIDMIGEGNSAEYLNDLCRKLNLSDKISFLGSKPRTYIYQNLCQYDLLVQPSRYEGFGLTVIEAMAAGVPVLVSDIEGPLEITNNGEYGYLFRNGDALSCADSMMKIIEEIKTGTIKHRITNSMTYVVRHYDIKVTAQNYIDYYKKFINHAK